MFGETRHSITVQLPYSGRVSDKQAIEGLGCVCSAVQLCSAREIEGKRKREWVWGGEKE